MSPSRLVARYREARSDPGHAVLEGFHAVKHALRFGAELVQVVSPTPGAVLDLASRLAPDIMARLEACLEPVPAEVFAALAPTPPATGVIGLARRPATGDPLATAGAPVVLLEAPGDLGNIGAVIRTAAAAGAAAVLTTGRHDPWHPSALRGAAGLHFALRVARVDSLPVTTRPILAIDPEGEPLAGTGIPDAAILAFGTERDGLSNVILARAGRRIAIPMQAGVSSLNLAASVAVVLYAWRLSRPEAGGR